MRDDDIKKIGHLGEEALRPLESLSLNGSSKEEILAEVFRRRAEEEDLLDDEARMILDDGL